MMAKAKPSADLVYLCRALNAPAMAAAIGPSAERARTETGATKSSWPHAWSGRWHRAGTTAGRTGSERRDSRLASLSGEFFDHQRSLNRDVVADRRERRESTSAVSLSAGCRRGLPCCGGSGRRSVSTKRKKPAAPALRRQPQGKGRASGTRGQQAATGPILR